MFCRVPRCRRDGQPPRVRTPQKVYDGGLVATRLVIDSVKKAGTVKRLVYTSSFAAVGHPAPEGHVYTEGLLGPT